jgi:CheY-like chemotaxis protein
MKILIIDDAIHIRRLIVRMLQRADVQTVEAGDGLEGLRLLKEAKPDIVTCDVAMPEMDGYEFLKTVKEDPKVCHIPVIIVTALGQIDEMVSARQMGADACITKPFSSSLLLETVHKLLDSH